MPDFTNEELLRIIDTGESDGVEFKESLSGSAADGIREAICAFANDLPGREQPGLVFVGVRNDRSLGNLSVTDELLRQLADMKSDGNILPPPSMTVEKRTLNDSEVAVVVVQPSNSPPVRCRGAIHIRTGPRRSLATAQDERILNEKRRFGDRPFDLQPIPIAGLDDLNLTQFENEYLTRAFSGEVLAANDRSREERLAATKMIVASNQPAATVLGILTIGKNTRDFLPGAYIQFLRINGKEWTDEILDSEEIGGTISDQIRRLDEKLRSHNRIGISIVDGLTELRNELYPMVVLQQLTRNAVMHRTYEATNAPIRVYFFNDRVEIISPGEAFGTVTSANFGQPGITDYRNPNLAEAMKTLGYVQRFGVGIPLARRLLSQAGHPELEFVVRDNHVAVTVRVTDSEEVDE